jgi:hypothetical protein
MHRLFTFAPADYAAHYKAHGYALIKDGVSAEFLDFVETELAHCEQDQDDISSRYDKRGRKQQYLFNFPEKLSLVTELVATMGRVTGLPADELVISERHIKVYPVDARPDPPPHKDRRASQIALGIPIVSPPEARLFLYPHHQRFENPFDSYDEFIRALPEADRPENSLKGVSPLVIDPQPGDLIVFEGSSIYHERMRAAGSKILYLKMNALGLNPIGENLSMLPLSTARDEDAVDAPLAEVEPA